MATTSRSSSLVPNTSKDISAERSVVRPPGVLRAVRRGAALTAGAADLVKRGSRGGQGVDQDALVIVGDADHRRREELVLVELDVPCDLAGRQDVERPQHTVRYVSRSPAGQEPSPYLTEFETADLLPVHHARELEELERDDGQVTRCVRPGELGRLLGDVTERKLA